MLLDKNSVKAHKNAAKSNASALARTDGVCWWTSVVVVVDLGANVLDDDDDDDSIKLFLHKF